MSQQAMPLGVVLERRPIEHPWAEWSWRAVAVIPGAGPVQAPRELVRDDTGARFHVATLELGLHRKETEGYRVNLSQPSPTVYVGLRPGADDGEAPAPFVVTVCPYEAEDYEIGGEERVDAVPMPPEVAALVGHFVDRHHVEEPFIKRKRQPHNPRNDDAASQLRGSAKGPRYG